MKRLSSWMFVAIACGGLIGCASTKPTESNASTPPKYDGETTTISAALTPEERIARCEHLRDTAARNGISSGFLFAGIAQAETNLSQCWSELTWACEGPVSSDCGGPVVAGAGDGPCDLQQGGLGMFQFDAGTFDDTIKRDGDGVLLIDGNVTRAVDFVLNMVINSVYVDVSNIDEAKAWLNQVTVDGPLWDAWIKTVTHYYNGCVPGSCGAYDSKYAHYDSAGRDVYNEMGAAFWQITIPPCESIPAAGRELEETDICFHKGGPLMYWRVGAGGSSNLHIWTGSTADATATNFAQWDLIFDEAGDYLLEVRVAGGTTPHALYQVQHNGVTETIAVDQSAASDYAPIGTFTFAAGGTQSVYLGDNTGDSTDTTLVVDTLRVTRVGGNGGSGGAAGSGGSNSAGSSGASGGAGASGEAGATNAAGSNNAGAGGANGGGANGGGGASNGGSGGGSPSAITVTGRSDEDSGSCAFVEQKKTSALGWSALAIFLGALRMRRRRGA